MATFRDAAFSAQKSGAVPVDCSDCGTSCLAQAPTPFAWRPRGRFIYLDTDSLDKESIDEPIRHFARNAFSEHTVKPDWRACPYAKPKTAATTGLAFPPPH
jgi:hypothetical protein